jgi:hypothetical protein
MHRLAAVIVLLCLSSLRAGAQAAASPSSVSAAAADAPASHPSSGLPSDTQRVDGPEKNSNEWQVWAAGSVPLGIFDTDPTATIWVAGATYGRVLTDAHAPSVFRGRFETGFEIDPFLEVDLPQHHVYAPGFTPVILKWDLVTRRRFSPYLEWAGGAVWGNHQVVPGTTTFNFMPSVGIGTNFPCAGAGKFSCTIDVRYFHISNAGLTAYNPGLNTVQIRLGFGLFTHPKR